MKRIYILLFLLSSVSFFFSCTKGDQYYADYVNITQSFDGTILEYLESQPGTFDSLVLVLDRLPELRDSLNDSGKEITLFAVTNRSFQIAIDAMNTARELSGRKPLYLEDLSKSDLDSLTSRYAFSGLYDTESLFSFKEGQTVASMRYGYDMNMLFKETDASGFVQGGQQQLMLSDVNNSIFQRYWKSINTASVNLYTSNGVLHILSTGHDFGFNKLTTKFSQ